MTIYTASVSGDWANSATWGGHTIGNNDVGIIPTNITVNYNGGAQCLGFQVTGGILVMNGTMTITDAPPHAGTTAHILIDATATNKLVSVITFASPAQIKSASAIPANPFIVKIYKTTGPELRIIDLDYYTLKGVRPYIGNELIGAYCNDASNVDSVWIDSVDPLERDTQMLEHVILGRDHSRIYRIGDKAGVCVVTGHCTWDSQFPALVRDIKASGNRISIVWDRVILPYCRIEGTPKINHKRGSLRIDYSLTLVEDW